MYEIQAPQRDELQKHLKQQGIQTGIHYPIPLHLQPAYQQLGYHQGSFPVSEHLANHIISLPMYPELTTEQLDYIIEQIEQFYS
jgi:dTDP-4-amino-4,6-dideoxygalactose transaminase